MARFDIAVKGSFPTPVVPVEASAPVFLRRSCREARTRRETGHPLVFRLRAA